MKLPLPRLLPGWIAEEACPTGAAPERPFLVRLEQRRWKILRPRNLEDAFGAEGADLVFVDSRTLLESPGHTTTDYFSMLDEHHVPLLIKGPLADLATLRPLFPAPPRVLLPEQLGNWWGPERMDEELVRNTPALAVTTVTLGKRWAMVETGTSVGMAAMPDLAGAGSSAEQVGAAGDFTERTLADLAEGLRLPAGIVRTIACAAVNAGILPPEDAGNGDGLTGHEMPGDGNTVIIGRFPKLPEKRPGAVVLERNPGPDDLPAEAAPYVIPGPGSLVVTASAWSNGTLSSLLRLGRDRHVTLVGPGTPLSPSLHAYGIHRLAGFVVQDRDSTRAVVAADGGVKGFKPFGNQIVLEAE